MTPLDPRAPVIVGAAHVDNRSDDAAEPIAMMESAARDALADAAVSPSAIEMIRVIRGIWPYSDPGRLLARRIGADDARTSLGVIGGNEVFDVTSDTAARIQRGELDVAVVCAAENLRTRRRDRAGGGASAYLHEEEGASPDEPPAEPKPHGQGRELDTGAVATAVSFYAMVETALRHRRGETVEEHAARVAALWARASAVAADNPDAWLRDRKTPDEIATPSAGNRWVSYPYPKLMTSNVNVDQGGAVVMVAAEVAERLGVPRDQWVSVLAGVRAHDHWFASTRWALDESPAMRIAGRRTLDLAGLGVDDCKYLDVYSCFPAAVQLAQRELGIGEEREFTITGGLTFGGGPLNCYCMLSLVRAARLLRDDPGERAFLTGNGGFFTKHSFLCLATEPPDGGFRTDDVQAAVDALPTRQEAADAPATATIEAYTVVYDREGRPSRSCLSCLTPDGDRWWAASEDPGLADALVTGDLVEATVRCTDDDVSLG